jgi:hypothetical protein
MASEEKETTRVDYNALALSLSEEWKKGEFPPPLVPNWSN